VLLDKVHYNLILLFKDGRNRLALRVHFFKQGRFLNLSLFDHLVQVFEIGSVAVVARGAAATFSPNSLYGK
jgi:hypothetical protein